MKFGIVGTSGAVVNLVVFQLSYIALASFNEDPRILSSNGIGIIVSIFTNFLLNDKWTWGDREKKSWVKRLIKFYAAASFAASLQLGMTWLSIKLVWSVLPTVFLDHDFGPVLGLMTGIGCGMFINFMASHFWAFKAES